MMLLRLLIGFCVSKVVYSAGSALFTLQGICPDVKLQDNLDFTKFSGIWYNVASYASDGRAIWSDCSTLDFQEDNMGYTFTETYVDQNKTQKTYFARVDPTFDAGNRAQFIISHEDNDKVLQFPFFILSTDYSNYAIAYTCRTQWKKLRTHYVFAWVLSRTKEALQGQSLRRVEDALAKHAELAENRKAFVFKNFDKSCEFDNKIDTDVFTNNFW